MVGQYDFATNDLLSIQNVTVPPGLGNSGLGAYSMIERDGILAADSAFDTLGGAGGAAFAWKKVGPSWTFVRRMQVLPILSLSLPRHA